MRLKPLLLALILAVGITPLLHASSQASSEPFMISGFKAIPAGASHAYPGPGWLAYSTGDVLYVYHESRGLVEEWRGRDIRILGGSDTLIYSGDSVGGLVVLDTLHDDLLLDTVLRGGVAAAAVDARRGIVMALDSQGVLYAYRLGSPGRLEIGGPGWATGNLSSALGIEGSIAVDGAVMPRSPLEGWGHDSTRTVITLETPKGRLLAVLNISGAPDEFTVVLDAPLPPGALLDDALLVGGRIYAAVHLPNNTIILYIDGDPSGSYALGEGFHDSLLAYSGGTVYLYASTETGKLYVFEAGNGLRLLHSIYLGGGGADLSGGRMILAVAGGKAYLVKPPFSPLWNGWKGVALEGLSGAIMNPETLGIALHGEGWVAYRLEEPARLVEVGVEVEAPEGVEVSYVYAEAPGSSARGLGRLYLEPGRTYLIGSYSPQLGNTTLDTGVAIEGGESLHYILRAVEASITVYTKGLDAGIEAGPVAGAEVELASLSGGPSYTGVSGPDGSVTLRSPYGAETSLLPPGTYRLRVSAPGFEDYEETVALEGGEAKIVVMLNPVSAVLRLELVDGERGGPAVPPFTVELAWPGGSAALLVDENPAVLEIPPGNYTVRIESPLYEASTAQVSAPANESIVLTPRTSIMGFRVLGYGGQPLPNATILLVDPYGYSVETHTDPQGLAYAEAPLAPSYRVRITAPHYHPIETHIGPNASETVFTLQPILYPVRIRAIDAYTGTPIEAALVIEGPGGRIQAGSGEEISLPAARYNVTVIAARYRESTTTIDVEGPVEANMPVYREEYSLIIDIEGYHETPTVHIVLEPVEHGIPGLELDAKGETPLKLPWSTYRIVATAPGYEEYTTTITLLGDQALHVSLKPRITHMLRIELPKIAGAVIAVAAVAAAYKAYKRRRGGEAGIEELEFEF